MKRKFRLARSTEIRRVRRAGRNYAHPLLVFYILRSSQPLTRICVVAGAGVGKAVVRNRTKRRIRAAFQGIYPRLVPGYDVMVIARKAVIDASWIELNQAVSELSNRAGLLANPVENGC